MNDQTVLSKARFRLAEIEEEHCLLDQEARRIETFLEIFEEFAPSLFQKSPPEITLPAKTSNAEREGDDSSAPIQESAPAMQQGPSEVVTPSSDESVTGREAVPDGLPATHSRQAAVDRDIEIDEQIELGASEAGRFDSGSLTEIVVKEEVRVLSAGESRGMQWPSGVGRSDSEESLAAGEATVSPAPIPPGKSGEAAPSASPALSLLDRIKLAHAEHPEWTAHDVAEHLKAKPKTVSAYGSMAGIKWPGTIKSRVPQFADRVAELHAAHPDWNGSQIASELSVGSGSVFNVVKRLGIVLPQGINSVRKGDSIASRVEAYHVANPMASTPEIATALGIEQKVVRTVGVNRKLTFRKLTKEERSAIQRAGQLRSIHASVTKPHAKPAPQIVQEARPVAPAPTPAPSTERQPAPIPNPVARIAPQRPAVPPAMLGPEAPFTVGDPDEDYIHPSLSKYPASPLGKKVSLRDRISGFYLHDSVTVLADKTMMLTVDPDRAWRGTREQLKNVRGKFPKTVELMLVAVPVRRKA